MENDNVELEQWWDALTEDQQALLKQAAQTYPADPSVVDLLMSSPIDAVKKSWTATSIAGGSSAVTIHDPIKSFVTGKIER